MYLRFENKFLISGLILGISLAFISIIEKNNFLEKETDWIAKIEDITISRAKYESQVEGLALDKRSPLTNEDRTFVLERMIEEELLIKRAIPSPNSSSRFKTTAKNNIVLPKAVQNLTLSINLS